MKKDSKILVAGSSGMVGSALVRYLKNNNYLNILEISSKDLDLRNQNDVSKYFQEYKPDYVFLAAAKVGGILSNNKYRAEFIYDNLMIQCNIINSSYLNDVKKLLFLGSSCIYPKFSKQPIKEEYLLSDYLEETNKPYAVAKISGIELCQSYRRQYGANFISVMPTNLYGPNDNYDLNNSHVLPALMRKFIEAKKYQKSYVDLWGTGAPKREFLHVDDLAKACIFLMKIYNDEGLVNVGTGIDIRIKDLAEMIKEITNYTGQVRWDSSKPDGTPRKLLDVTKINNLGWKAEISLKDGLTSIYKLLTKPNFNFN